MSTETPMLKVTINGQTLEVPKGWSIIQAADEAGITIPRFCYHKKLSVAANCRMCLVDVEGARKPTPACASPVADGMVVYTKSQKTIAYQKAVMEFLLINHPLDCPICDQGGECELQDVAMGYGKDVSRYNQGKRSVPQKDIGPLVATDLTRCIHCTRCVRFGEEIAGMKELGMTNRGGHAEIATFLSQPLDSEMSGNVIDLCPVGALTSKPFRYQARAWEMQQYPFVSPHDCVGSNLYGHVRRGALMRVVPRENEALNEVWCSDRDRFSYQALSSPARAQRPMIKRDGEWDEVDWSEAFEYLVKKFHAIANEHGAEKIGALASPASTTEEFYLLQKLLRAIGSPNIDHRLRQCDDRQLEGYGAYPGLNCELNDINQADVVLIIGADLRRAQPILHHRVRQASRQGAKVVVLNPVEFDHRFEKAKNILVNTDELILLVAQCLKGLIAAKGWGVSSSITQLLENVVITDAIQELVTRLAQAKRPILLAGDLVYDHPSASDLLALLGLIFDKLPAKGGILTQGANTAGAWLAGAVPHQGPGRQAVAEKGLSAKQMLTQFDGLKAYVLLQTEPNLDSSFGFLATENLQQAECVVALTAFATENLKAYADIILPVSAYTETAGTYVNVCGQPQHFSAISRAPGEAKPAWKVLRVLANFLEVAGFDYATLEEVQAEIAQTCQAKVGPGLDFTLPLALPTTQKQLKRVPYWPLYAVDTIVRQAPALQATDEMQAVNAVYVHPNTAAALQFAEGDLLLLQQNHGSKVTLPLKLDATLSEKAVMVAMGTEYAARLGQAYDQISLVRV